MNELKDRLRELAKRLESAIELLNLEDDRAEVKKLEEQTSAPDFWNDQESAQIVMQKIADLNKHIDGWDSLTNDLNSLCELAEDTQENDHQMIKELESNFSELEKKFEKYEFDLLFSGDHDRENALLSIHAGTGGTDAQDWSEMLLRMFLRFCEKNDFRATILNQSDGEEAGIKSVTIEIKGYHAYGYLKSEHGVHRLVRLSPFNSDHARQTSFALVEVIPEIENIDTKIDEKDLRIDTFRAGGHGGQSVNTTDSAVRITHLPTGITASSQNERSQLQNKQLAMKVLQARIHDFEEKKKAEENAKIKGENISAEWGNQIRSYVLHPYTMVKDHRTDAETSNTNAVLDGDLDLFIEAYLRKNVT